MQFRDLKAQYEQHRVVIDDAILKTVSGVAFIGGRQVTKLEEALAEYVGVKHCITCANGTDALQLALMAWEIGEGDAVFIPDFTFFSSGEVVPTVGATPVFVDIDRDTFNISIAALEEQVKWVKDNTDLRPRVIVAVDLFGQPARHDEIRKIADKYGMYVLEDGAQGFGGRIGDKKACSFGDISTTSFFPAKPLGCYGDGGAIFTDNDEWATMLRSLKVHGKGEDKYDNVRIGMNSRLDTIQAAVLLEKMRFFDEEVSVCNNVAEMYARYLADCSGVALPTVLEEYMSSWAQYTILVESSAVRERLMSVLKQADIPSMIYYRKPMHMQGAFRDNLVGMDSYAVTEEVCGRCLSLPMSAYVTEEDVREICEVVRGVVG